MVQTPLRTLYGSLLPFDRPFSLVALRSASNAPTAAEPRPKSVTPRNSAKKRNDTTDPSFLTCSMEIRSESTETLARSVNDLF
jgi:hypothetical protein